MVEIVQQSRFLCHCCERELEGHLCAQRELISQRGVYAPLCKQCDGFISIGLPHVVGRLNKKKLEVAEPRPHRPPSAARSRPTPRPPSAPPVPEVTDHPPEHAPNEPQKKQRKVRPASATECDAFSNRSLAVTRYIDGFIQGLETAGLNRNALKSEATNAINILLGISQKLSSERLKVLSGMVSRSDVRRLTRHIKETSLMVDEYVNAVKDACQHIHENRRLQ